MPLFTLTIGIRQSGVAFGGCVVGAGKKFCLKQLMLARSFRVKESPCERSVAFSTENVKGGEWMLPAPTFVPGSPSFRCAHLP